MPDQAPPSRLPRRLLLVAPALALSGLARASSWPDRPVRLVVPNPPGGSTDIFARLLAAGLSARLPQPIVVENRPGAGGNIGMEAVAKSPPDGHVLGIATVSQWVINPFLYRRMPYDPRTELTYVSLCWEVANMMVVPAAHVPAQDLAGFIAWAKARGQPLVFTSPGIGTSAHLMGSLFGRRTGIEVVHSPFRGAAEAVPAVLRGDAQFTIDNITSWLGVLREGRVRALGVAAGERSPLVPEVPTMAEAGQPEFVATIWGGIVGPAGMPAEAVAVLSAALQEIGRDPALAERFTAAGARLRGTTPAEMVARAERERGFWGELVQISGARAE